MSLFQRKIEPRCAYCIHSRPLSPEQIVCPKKGVMDAGSHCAAFKYDPLRRTPPRPAKADFSKLTEKDFAL